MRGLKNPSRSNLVGSLRDPFNQAAFAVTRRSVKDDGAATVRVANLFDFTPERIAFFLAAFVGVAYAGIALLFKDKLTKAMPYGPFLAIATLMVVLGKPLVEIGLGRIFGMDTPLNLP